MTKVFNITLVARRISIARRIPVARRVVASVTIVAWTQVSVVMYNGTLVMIHTSEAAESASDNASQDAAVRTTSALSYWCSGHAG